MRRNRSETSQILTSTPYRKRLEEKLNKLIQGQLIQETKLKSNQFLVDEDNSTKRRPMKTNRQVQRKVRRQLEKH